jgi:hypothetical protein
MAALHSPPTEILARSLGDAAFAGFGDLMPKKSLCFQWSIVWFCKFSQTCFWPKRGKSMTCGSENLDSWFLDFATSFATIAHEIGGY